MAAQFFTVRPATRDEGCHIKISDIAEQWGKKILEMGIFQPHWSVTGNIFSQDQMQYD